MTSPEFQDTFAVLVQAACVRHSDEAKLAIVFTYFFLFAPGGLGTVNVNLSVLKWDRN